jgi:hypothetical protein
MLQQLAERRSAELAAVAAALPGQLGLEARHGPAA